MGFLAGVARITTGQLCLEARTGRREVLVKDELLLGSAGFDSLWCHSVRSGLNSGDAG